MCLLLEREEAKNDNDDAFIVKTFWRLFQASKTAVWFRHSLLLGWIWAVQLGR